MMIWINQLLARVGLGLVLPAWAGYVAAAAAALLLVWRIYSAGLEAGRGECAAAALAEQTRQLDANDRARREADARAVDLLERERKTRDELIDLDNQAGSAAGADLDCLDADSVRRIQRIR